MLRILAFLLALTCAASAQVPMTGAGLAVPVASSSGCATSAAFIVRQVAADPTHPLSATETTAYQNLICGMVTDGTWSLFDALYIFATNTQTTAKLNLVSTSYGITATLFTNITFVADQGYSTSDIQGLQTNFTPPGTNFTQNSAALGYYQLTSSTTESTNYILDEETGNGYDISIRPRDGSGNFSFRLTQSSAAFTSGANANLQGQYAVLRTASNVIAAYKNGNSTPIATGTLASTAISGASQFCILGGGTTCSTVGQVINGVTISAFWFGGGMTQTNVLAVQSRVNAFMTALGINVY